MMRVLFIYSYLPGPDLGHGGARVVSRLLRDLKDDARITLVCAFRPGERPHVDSVRDLCHRLVAVERPFASDMGRVRRTTERGTTSVRMLTTGFPVPVVKLRRSALRRAIAEVLRGETFDLIHVENASMAQYVELFPPGVPAVLVDHEAGGSGEEPQRWAAYVQSFYPRFRRVVCLSEGDALHLRSLVPGLEVRVRPPGIVIPDAIVRRPQPDRVLFFGSPDHLPNRDALQWMGTEILPALQRRRPEARILCAGFDPAETSGASALRKSGLQLLGFVDDLDAELAQASIVLSPVRQGRGIRIKNLETLAHGVPLLTTPLGRRGLEDVPEDALAVAEDTESLATRAAELLEDPTGTEAMGARGRVAVRDLFTFDHQATATREVWNELVSGA